MSHQEVLDLLQRQADMSGYGMDFECPHCSGSGLIGGFAGARSLFSEAANIPMTVAQRKAFRAQVKSTLGAEDKPRKIRTPADRLAAAQALIARGGQPKARAKAKKYSAQDVLTILEEMKV